MSATGEYPCPVSPAYPAASKDVELRRAITASARSATYSAAVVFEDEWLAVVDKPAGVYCDAFLSALPGSTAVSGDPATKLNLHLANRLDRDTSGLMVITKRNKVAGKSLSRIKHVYNWGVSYHAGNGKSISFWKDNWIVWFRASGTSCLSETLVQRKRVIGEL